MSKLTLYSCDSREKFTGLYIYIIAINALLRNPKFKKIGNLKPNIMKKILHTHEFGVVCKVDAKRKIKFLCELSPKHLLSKLFQCKNRKKLMK